MPIITNIAHEHKLHRWGLNGSRFDLRLFWKETKGEFVCFEATFTIPRRAILSGTHFDPSPSIDSVGENPENDDLVFLLRQCVMMIANPMMVMDTN